MILKNRGIYYIELKNYILKYRTNVDKLSIFKYDDLPNTDMDFFNHASETDLNMVYKHEIFKQVFGGGNA